jgi:hypothetical protein
VALRIFDPHLTGTRGERHEQYSEGLFRRLQLPQCRPLAPDRSGDQTIWGYATVSTDGQTLEAQVAELRSAGAAKIFREKVSGAIRDRNELSRALAALIGARLGTKLGRTEALRVCAWLPKPTNVRTEFFTDHAVDDRISDPDGHSLRTRLIHRDFLDKLSADRGGHL